MLLKIKEKLIDSQLISIEEVKQQKLIDEIQNKILPISKLLAMYLFKATPVDFETFKQNNMNDGLIHDIINFSDINSGEFFITSFVVVKNREQYFNLSTSYLVHKWALALYCTKNQKRELLWCRYCNDIDELVGDLESQIISNLSNIIDQFRS